jgi:hypothetical protein
MSISHNNTHKTELYNYHMLLAPIIQALLTNQNVPYHLVNSATPENLTQAHASISLLKDASGTVIAIYNNDHQFDLFTLKALLNRPKLRFMSIDELGDILTSLKNSNTKPFNETSLDANSRNDLQLIIDEPMSIKSIVLLVTDNPDERIQVDIWDMQVMVENALIGGIFSRENKPDFSLSQGMNIVPLKQVINEKPTFG